MQKTIAILATLDTKAAEVAYIMDLIEARGHRVLVVDAGVLGEAPFVPGVNRDVIARATGMSIEEVRGLPNEGQAISIMAEGAARVVRALYDEGRLDAILSVGGSMGTSVGLAAMRSLPVGVPKLMVSTIGFSPLVTPDAVANDQVMMQVPVDLYGLNAINRHSLDAAAAAICAMAEGAGKVVAARPLVAVTTRGIMHYLQWIKPALEARGYEVVVIHAVGTVGGGTFENLVSQGLFCAVLDLCTGEVIEELNGGALRAGPGRLEAAGEMGIPQVVAPGCMDFFHWPGSPESAPPDRKVHIHNSLVVGVKATTQEMVAAAEVMGRKLNRAKGPVKVLIPLLGWDLHDQPGHIFHDPEGRAAFLDALKRCLHPRVEIVELNCHINDQPFAEAVLLGLDTMLEGRL
jgi:uncharacterized protein (UPF0261 family)